MEKKVDERNAVNRLHVRSCIESDIKFCHYGRFLSCHRSTDILRETLTFFCSIVDFTTLEQ